MQRLRIAVVLLALAVLAGAQVWLARVESEGPPQRWAELPGGVPSRLYLPGSGPAWPPPPPPRGERPPALVLVHGYSGDQVGLSGLARSLVGAGFAVMTIDLRGHGANRRPFHEGTGLAEQFDLELRAAVDHLRRHPDVDGSRIALAGHSMGAGAVLEYATRDTSIDAVVMISGGWEMSGPHRPPNAFFIYAENDLPYIPESSDALAARIAGQASLARDRTYGDVSAGTGVRVHRVAGANHGTIVRSDDTVAEMAVWLDGVWGTPSAGRAVFDDPRLPPSRVALGAFLVVLLGLGGAAGRLAARFEPDVAAPESRLAHLVPIALSLVAVLPFFALWSPGLLLGTTDADRAVSYLASVGVVLLAGLVSSDALSDRLAGLRAGSLWGSVAVGAAAVAAGYVLFAPWAVTLRGLSLTPERAWLALWIAAALIPFTLAFHLLTAGGSLWRAAFVRVVARLLVLVAMGAGLFFELFGFPTRVLLPVLAINVVWLELIFTPYYGSSRNALTAAVLEALWLGWHLAVVLPASL